MCRKIGIADVTEADVHQICQRDSLSLLGL
jgi:hypothetical protein